MLFYGAREAPPKTVYPSLRWARAPARVLCAGICPCSGEGGFNEPDGTDHSAHRRRARRQRCGKSFQGHQSRAFGASPARSTAVICRRVRAGYRLHCLCVCHRWCQRRPHGSDRRLSEGKNGEVGGAPFCHAPHCVRDGLPTEQPSLALVRLISQSDDTDRRDY
jgi:hypothetical protein